MDRVHRQELKHDKFVDQVGQTVSYAAEHRQQVIKITGAVLAVVLAVLGIYLYRQHQAGVRQDALREAIKTQEATVGQAPSEFILAYSTQADKDKAVQKSWQDLANKYSGSSEGLIAHYYMGVNAADKGNISEAEKHFRTVADSGKDAYASQAKLALANIYEASGRQAEAEKTLRSLMNDPTVLVSKEQATLTLAKLIAKSKPAEARKLLEPLRTSRGAVSRAVITTLGEIPAR